MTLWRGIPEEIDFKLPPLLPAESARKAFWSAACLAGSVLFPLIQRFKSISGEPPRRILIVRRGGLGDALMMTPLLQALRDRFADASISVLIGQQAVGVLEDNRCVDRIYAVPASKNEWWGLFRRLRRERFDTAFILHRFFVPSLLAVALGIPRRLGFYWKRHGFALTAGVPFDPTRSQVVQIAELMTLVGEPAPEPKLYFDPGAKPREGAAALLREWGYEARRPLIGMHAGGGETAGSSEPAKRWLPERFGAVADLLARRDAAQILLLGGPGDEPFISATRNAMRASPLRMVSGLDLKTFAAVVGACDVMISNDSGPMHIAVTQDVPVVAICGPTHPRYTPPVGEKHKVLWAGVSCSPCYNPDELAETIPLIGKKGFTCWRGTHECMKAITVEDVYAAVKERLASLKKVS